LIELEHWNVGDLSGQLGVFVDSSEWAIGIRSGEKRGIGPLGHDFTWWLRFALFWLVFSNADEVCGDKDQDNAEGGQAS